MSGLNVTRTVQKQDAAGGACGCGCCLVTGYWPGSLPVGNGLRGIGVFLGDERLVCWGEPFCGCHFRLSLPGFFRLERRT